MQYVQVICNGNSHKFEKATSVYKLRNLLIIEFINDNNKEEAFAIQLSEVQKLFVGSRRVLLEKLVDRQNPEEFDEEE